MILKAISSAAFVVVSFLATNLAPATASTPHNLTRKQARALEANAKTPEDHARLARHYEIEAITLEYKAIEHEQMGKQFRENPSALALKSPMSPVSAPHCDYLASSYSKAADVARERATMHRRLMTQQ